MGLYASAKAGKVSCGSGAAMGVAICCLTESSRNLWAKLNIKTAYSFLALSYTEALRHRFDRGKLLLVNLVGHISDRCYLIAVDVINLK